MATATRAARRRVLVVSERFHPESFLVNEIVADLAARGHEVTVITQAPSYPEDRIFPGYRNSFFRITRELGARVMRVRTVLGYKRNVIVKMLNYVNFALLALFVRLVAARCHDAIFVFHTGPLTQALAATVPSRARRSIWTQDVWPDAVFEYGFSDRGLAARLLRRFVKAVYSAFDEVMVTSPGFVEGVAANCSRGVVPSVVPQWAPSSIRRGVRDPYEPGFVDFVFAGNVGSMQNLEAVVAGFLRARAADARLRFHVIGDGSALEAVRKAAGAEADSSVVFHGRKPMEEMGDWLDHADFLVLPLVGTGTVSRTIPAKFQAYLAAGRPILAIARGTVASLVRDGALGFVADPDDGDSIAAAFARAASTEERERAAMGSRARETLARDYDRDAILAKIRSAVLGGAT